MPENVIKHQLSGMEASHSPKKDSPNKLRLKMMSNTDKKNKDSITVNEKENKYELTKIRSTGMGHQ